MARKPKIATEPPEAATQTAPSASPIHETASPEPTAAETTAMPLPPPAVAAPWRYSLGGILGAVVAASILGGGVVASWPVWAPRLAALLPIAMQDPFSDTRMIGIADRLALLEQRLETLPSDNPNTNDGKLDELAATQQRLTAEVRTLVSQVDNLRQSVVSVGTDTRRPDEDTALATRLTAIEQAVQALSIRLNDGAARIAGLDAIEARYREQADAIAKLSSRIEQLAGLLQTERQTLAAATPRLDLAIALSGLRQALSSSAPFRQELAAAEKALHDSGSDTALLAALATQAPHGIPTLSVLRRRFEALAADIVHADAPTGSDSWFERVAERIKGLVTVRRIGSPEGASDVDASVARAEAALAADELAEAVGELERLHGKPADTAQSWLEDARARLAAERTLTELEVRLARSAPGGGGR